MTSLSSLQIRILPTILGTESGLRAFIPGGAPVCEPQRWVRTGGQRAPGALHRILLLLAHLQEQAEYTGE